MSEPVKEVVIAGARMRNADTAAPFGWPG